MMMHGLANFTFTGNNTAGFINPYVILNIVWKPNEENKLGLERKQERLCM